ncbi:MAG: hypothetical protein ABJA62_03070 [Luteimonas sp.]
MSIASFSSPSHADRSPQRRRAALAGAVLAAVLSGNAWADDDLNALGGNGGDQFRARCANDQVLIGFELRAGDDVGAIRPLCVTSFGASKVSAASPGDWHGGAGGSLANVVCPREQPIVTGLLVGAEGPQVRVVNNIYLFCGDASAAQVAGENPLASFNAPDYDNGSHGRFSLLYDGDKQRCRAGQVAVGVHGRSGALLDAIGLICDALPLPAKTIGRVNVSKPSPPHPAGWTICDAARDARGRNSPAAPNLEAQCAKLPAKSIGRVSDSSVPSPIPAESQATPAGSDATEPDPTQSDPGASKTASRDAALRELMSSVVAGIQQSRRRSRGIAPRPRGDAISDQHADSADRGRYDDSSSEPGANEIEQSANVQDMQQPEHSIRVEVRYPVAYGYKETTGAPDPEPNSCAAFYVSVHPLTVDRSLKLMRIDTQPRMRNSNGAYACDYLIPDLAFDQAFSVRVAMSDERTAGSAVWLDGDQTQPPAGERRTVVDGVRRVTLTANQPRASLSFEMTYSGSP